MRVLNPINTLAVKLALIHANSIKGMHRACKTILAFVQNWVFSSRPAPG
jgi:hypothetical protein